MTIKWIPLLGNFEFQDETIVFTGGSIIGEDGKTYVAVGNLLCNQFFGGGTIEASIEFVDIGTETACGLILHYQPATYSFVEAQLGTMGFCSVWTFTNNRWFPHGQAGEATQIKAGRPYRLRVNAVGSSVTMLVDDVHLLTATLPFPLPRGQAGIWCRSSGAIHIRNFTMEAKRSIAFVVMQFTAPYNELYAEVIKPVCEQLGLTAVRLDETFGPGVIIQDIERQILEAQVIIADITPSNSNVYYEVGYAHALKKPTILISEKATQLPFDVSPFRVLFYENTISGKAKVEAGLRNHILAIQGPPVV